MHLGKNVIDLWNEKWYDYDVKYQSLDKILFDFSSLLLYQIVRYELGAILDFSHVNANMCN